MFRLNNWKYIVGGIGIIFITISLLCDTWLYPYLYQSYTSGRAEKVQKLLVEKQKEAEEYLESVIKIPLPELPQAFQKLHEESDKNHVLLYIKRIDGGFIYYSTNSVFPGAILTSPADSEVQHLSNGYYFQSNIAANGLVYISLVPIQYQYAIENQYLKNYIPFLKNNDDFDISKNQQQGFPIYDSAHRYLFSLSPKTAIEPFAWIAILYLVGFAFIFAASSQLISGLFGRRKKLLAMGLFVSVSAFFIYMWKIARLPDNLYRMPLFSPHYYGSSSFFSSLGDLLFFSIMISFFVIFLRRFHFKNRISHLPLQLLLFAIVSVSFLLSAAIVALISSLILDSVISFDLGNIFSLDFYSFTGIIIILILVAAYFGFLDYFSKIIFNKNLKPADFFVFSILGLAFAIFILSFTSGSYFVALGFNAGCIMLYYYRPRFFSRSKIAFSLSCITLAGLFLSIVLTKYNKQNEIEDRQTYASKVITERDLLAEYLFTNIYEGIQQDNYIKNYFSLPVISEPVLQNRIQQVYLSGYFSKYDVEISTFTPDGLPYKNPLSKPLSFYSMLLNKEGAQANADHLFFLHLHTGLPTYVSEIPINVEGKTIGILLVEFQQKPFLEESIYPALLVSEDLGKYGEMDKYSYAVYSDGTLLNQKGEYAYPAVQNFRVSLDSNNFASFTNNGFDHLAYQPHPNLLVLVSIKSQGWIYYLSSFAFVFFLMVIAYAILLYTRYYYRILKIIFNRKKHSIKNSPGIQNLSFRNKILITVISGMTLSMILIGIVTVSYIMVQYNKDELDNLRKKTRLIATKLSDGLQQNEKQPELGSPDLRLMVKTLSDNYQADINIFDVKGNLVNSTEKAIFDKGLLAPEMDAQAYLKFTSERTSQVIHEEKIGTLKFLSCYIPIRNLNGQVIGYLNLPYFSKEQELKDRISSFVVALINLYFLLFLILVVLGIFMTRVLTSPLNIIRNHLKNTSLSGTNEFIAWNTNDEIGKLVNEYNTMIVALKESVDRLAQSEREDALRELAQHVAHEIKNPLTPMKLGIQQLQNAYRDKSADYDILFNKVTNLIITQIDTLSAIATEFNDSAKIGNPVPVSVNTLLQQISDLFSHNASLSIRLDLETDADTKVLADANKLTRVFTNLLNNAVQAIPETRRGIINIKSQLTQDEVIITVEDNGTGIPENLRKKIFVPNFSTKSSGTGLGLAIVKAIIEQAGGSISFSSIEDKGSVFKVTLPVYDPILSELENEQE